MHRESVFGVADLSVFVDVSESVCLERRIKRDIAYRGRTRESVLAQYERTVGPMYRQFVQPSIKNADLVVQNNDEHEEAVEKLLLKVRSLLLSD